MKDLKEILDLILSGDKNVLIAASLMIIVWIYKEARSRYIIEKDFEVTRTDKTLEQYGAIENSLIKYIKRQNNTNEEEMFKVFSTSYSYISKGIFESWSDYVSQPNINKLESLLKDVQKEINLLHTEQYLRIDITNTNVFYYYIHHFRTFFVSSFITITQVILIYIIISLVIYTDNPERNWYEKLNLLTVYATGFLMFMFIYALSQLLLDRKFEHNKKNWTLVACLIVLFMFAFFIDCLRIIILPIIIFLIFFRFPKINKNTSNQANKHNGKTKYSSSDVIDN